MFAVEPKASIYLHIQNCFADRTAVVLLVFPWGVADHTDGLFVQQAIQLELLVVGRAHLSWITVQLPSCLFHREALLLHTRLTQVLQGQTGHGVVQVLGSAQRAVPSSSPSSPVLLQAGSTEAVGALEDHRVPEDGAAYGTGQVLLGQRQPACHSDSLLLVYPERESRAKVQKVIKHRRVRGSSCKVLAVCREKRWSYVRGNSPYRENEDSQTGKNKSRKKKNWQKYESDCKHFLLPVVLSHPRRWSQIERGGSLTLYYLISFCSVSTGKNETPRSWSYIHYLWVYV